MISEEPGCRRRPAARTPRAEVCGSSGTQAWGYQPGAPRRRLDNQRLRCSGDLGSIGELAAEDPGKTSKENKPVTQERRLGTADAKGDDKRPRSRAAWAGHRWLNSSGSPVKGRALEKTWARSASLRPHLRGDGCETKASKAREHLADAGVGAQHPRPRASSSLPPRAETLGSPGFARPASSFSFGALAQES